MPIRNVHGSVRRSQGRADGGRRTRQGEPVTTAPSTSASLAERLDGLLFFPVTAYGPHAALDLEVYRTHVRRGIEAGAGAVFACCGTGEFHALTPEEFHDCVTVAVEEAAAVEAAGGVRVPVVAGAGDGTRVGAGDHRAEGGGRRSGSYAADRERGAGGGGRGGLPLLQRAADR